jgi:transposase
MPRRSRRSFSAEFKQRAVELARTTDRPLTQICAELDISETALRRWIFQAESAAHQPEPAVAQLSAEERDELRRLRYENRILREEREILKKAAAFFATESETR